MLSFDVRREGTIPTLLRSPIVAVIKFVFIELFPHLPVGASEVHQTSDSSLHLILVASPKTISRVVGLMYQAC